jgi:serine protease
MRQIGILLVKPAIAGVLGLFLASAVTAAPEWNPVRSHPVEIGPQASRLVVGFRATPGNSVTRTIRSHTKAQVMSMTQAQTSEADVSSLSLRTGVAVSRSRQLTPSMHVVFLQRTVYGADVDTVLTQLRSDPAVAFADVDERRYPHALPNDLLFFPTATSSGQWYMRTPSTATPSSDAAATDAVSAWDITTGSSGTVIADVDSGIRFDHPDLLRAGFDSSRAGFGGRLLPGYDFVGQDLNAGNGGPLGTFLIANDGDGWDPDPSDPGDWIDSTDLKNSTVFPAKNCSTQNSSWHGTRVMGVLGALTNNNTGIAGMTWNPYLLPVRALGKCGGLDSDIITGIEWAVGMSINEVPDNPYPADIINLSLGGTGSACPTDYQSLITQLTSMGVLVVASAGNESGPVDIPANCPGVLAVAGLRNVGTKVGYSSLGPEVGIGAPAGNCVNAAAGSPCLRSIDTTVNEGATTPGANSYSDQTNSNLGTSFSAPIVSGIAALMRAANANLTPRQIIARMKASATPYPQPAGVAQCANGSTSNVECACTTTAPTTCGAGMVNALKAVKAALNPIAAVTIPAGFTSSGTFDAGGSVAACGATIASYAWTSTPAIHIVSGGSGSAVNVMASGAGTLTVVVTDSAGNKDTAVVTFTTSGASTAAPAFAGTASACIADMTVAPAAPTLSAAYSPDSVATNAASTFVVTFTNSNGYVLTQSGITLSIPAGLTLGTQAPATSCSGAAVSLANTSSSVTLAGANIPVNGSCNISFSVKSATAGTYTTTVAANDLMTGPAAGNTAPASASLTVTAAGASGASTGSGGGGGGGGSMDWLDIMLITGVLLIVRGHAAKRNRP